MPEQASLPEGDAYAVRLRDLEARVDELKDQIRRGGVRLQLLDDDRPRPPDGARASIIVRNEAPAALRVSRALVVLDGAVQYNRSFESSDVVGESDVSAFEGPLSTGDHVVAVLIELQSTESTAEHATVQLQSSHAFTSREGERSDLVVAVRGEVEGASVQPTTGIEWRDQ